MGNGNVGVIVAAVVLVLVVVGIVVLLASMRLRAQVKAWGELASELRLTINRKGRPGAPVWLEGNYHGRPVILDTYTKTRHHSVSGKRRATVDTFTRLVMQVSNPSVLSFEPSREGALAKVTQRIVGKDIQTGDPELDKRLSINGEPEEGVQRLLTAEALRQPLLEAPKLDLRLSEAGELTYRQPGVEKDRQRLRSIFELLAALAREIEHAA